MVRQNEESSRWMRSDRLSKLCAFAPSTGASRSCSTVREVNMPHSTAGPSGPRLQPEPSVATAAAVRLTEATGCGCLPLVISATWPAKLGPRPSGPHAARRTATARPPAAGMKKVYHGRTAASEAAIPFSTAGSPYSVPASIATDALNVATPSPVSAPVRAAPLSSPANERSELLVVVLSQFGLARQPLAPLRECHAAAELRLREERRADHWRAEGASGRGEKEQ
eukprot:scaffold263402_cov32-Tisochrysis_lutea.AAC.3